MRNLTSIDGDCLNCGRRWGEHFGETCAPRHLGMLWSPGPVTYWDAICQVIPCPTCKASAGSRCVEGGATRRPYHVDRCNAAVATGMYFDHPALTEAERNALDKRNKRPALHASDQPQEHA